MASVMNSSQMSDINSVQEAFNTSFQRHLTKDKFFLQELKKALANDNNL